MPVVVADTRTSLLTLQEDLERDQRFTVNGRIGVLTAAMLDLDDQLVTHRDLVGERLDRVDQRLSHVESDLVDVKSDVAELKTDMAKVLVQVDRLPQMDARLERLAGLFERAEREGKRKE